MREVWKLTLLRAWVKLFVGFALARCSLVVGFEVLGFAGAACASSDSQRCSAGAWVDRPVLKIMRTMDAKVDMCTFWRQCLGVVLGPSGGTVLHRRRTGREFFRLKHGVTA